MVLKTRSGNSLMPGGKKDDPKYIQLSGLVPKELGLQLKSLAALNEMTISDAIEEAVKDWVSKKTKKSGGKQNN